MGWFGDLDLGLKYVIVIASLIVLVFAAGFAKLFYVRHQTRKIESEAKAKAANEGGKVEQIALNQREEEEGDLFGIRALERGFYGGVAQSRPTTPTAARMSNSTLIHSAANIPFGAGNSRSVSATSSVITIDVGNPKPQATNVAVDMQLSVPNSPRLPRSPEPLLFPRSPSPLSHSSPELESDTLTSGLEYSSAGPKIRSNKPQIQANDSTRGMAVFSDAGSVVDEDSPPASPSGSGSVTNFGRSPSPLRQPQIMVHGPGSNSLISTEREIPIPTVSVRGYPAQLSVGSRDSNNRFSLAEVYDSYYDGKKREMSN